MNNIFKLKAENPYSLIQVSEFSTILVIIFCDILMFDKIFVSPQVKRIEIIGNKHGIYKFPNDVRLIARRLAPPPKSKFRQH